MAHRGTRAPFGQSLRYLGRGPPAEDKLNVDDGVVGHILEVLEKQVHLGEAAPSEWGEPVGRRINQGQEIDQDCGCVIGSRCRLNDGRHAREAHVSIG